MGPDQVQSLQDKVDLKVMASKDVQNIPQSSRTGASPSDRV